MPTPQRATIAQDLSSRIDTWLGTATAWADPQAFWVKAMTRDAQKLQSADALAGSEARAMVAHLSGDLPEAERWVRNLQQLGGAERAAYIGALVHSNLGYFSRAVAQVRERPRLLDLSPSVGKFTFISGGFDLLAHLSPAEIGEDWAMAELSSLAGNMADALRTGGVTAAHATQALDIAGEVLRRHRIFFSGDTPTVHALPDQVLFQLTVNVSTQELAAMNDEFIDALVERDLDRSAFAFAFILQA